MAKKRTHPEIEYFRGKIRELEALNKALKRRLRQLEKREHMLEDLRDVEDEEPILADNTTWCIDCGKGTLGMIDLGMKQYTKCSHCQIVRPHGK